MKTWCKSNKLAETNRPNRVELLVKTANNKKFEYSQSKAFHLYPCFSEKNETVHLQLHLPCLGDNRSENDTWRAFGPNGFAWSSNSSYQESGVGCCDWWAQELYTCNVLGNAAMFWKLQIWPKAHRREFFIEFQLELFCVNKMLPDGIGSNYPKSADLRLYQ